MKFSLVVAAASLVAGCSPAQAATYREAVEAYGKNKVAEAERMFAAVAADPASTAADRAGAHRQLGRIAWLVDGDAARASSRLQAAVTIGHEPCETGALAARVLEEAGRGQELLDRAATLLAACPERWEADQIRLRLVAARLDLAAGGGQDHLSAAHALWTELDDDARTSLVGARAGLEVALLRGDAAAALGAWRSYFWLSDKDAPQAILTAVPDAGARFAAGLAAQATPESRLALVELLNRAGFAEQARRFAGRHELERAVGATPAWRKAAAYWAFRDRADAVTLTAYRNIARGRPQPSLERPAREAMGALLQAAGVSGDPSQAMLRAYGLYGQVGATDGFPSIHFGHAVEDRDQPVEQYGRRARVRFVVLDNMVSNGFQSWLWDGDAATGGWTTAGPVIVQVRPQYTSDPLSLWRLHGDTPAKRRLLERQPGRARADAAALSKTGIASLSGLPDRLRLQAAAQIAAKVATITTAPDEFRRAFLEEAWRATAEHSIFIHEGRHALDKQLGRFNDVDLEYRAKLSELALATYPRLALYQMVTDVGGKGDHRRANAEVMKVYVAWMKANRAQVSGWAPAVPALAQLDRLTDEQIRAVARAKDPLATAE